MNGYCRGNLLVLYRMTVSARLLIMARPFTAYMYRDGGKTVISGSFRFSVTSRILALVWLANDVFRMVEAMTGAAEGNITGNIVSLCVLPVLLMHTVWKDKSQQQKVIDYMKNELNADLKKI